MSRANSNHDSIAMRQYQKKYHDYVESIESQARTMTNNVAAAMDENDAPAVVDLGNKFCDAIMKALTIPKGIDQMLDDFTTTTEKLDEAQGGAK